MRIYDNATPDGRSVGPTWANPDRQRDLANAARTGSTGPMFASQPVLEHEHHWLGERYQEQFTASVRGTAPQHHCGHWMVLRPKLRDTPWHKMKPESPLWDEQTERRLVFLRSAMEGIRAAGQSQYVCLSCPTKGQMM